MVGGKAAYAFGSSTPRRASGDSVLALSGSLDAEEPVELRLDFVGVGREGRSDLLVAGEHPGHALSRVLGQLEAERAVLEVWLGLVEHFTQLQRAYKNAFNTMTDEYDSDLIHALDQQVLNESEPHFRNERFRVELPDDPAERVTGVLASDEKVEATLSAYTHEIETELHQLFGVERPADDS